MDCRLLPGDTPEDVERCAPSSTRGLRARVDRANWGYALAARHTLWNALDEYVQSLEAGARLAPLACAGFTDGHLREAFGTVAYGFFPLRTMDQEIVARVIHSADEAGRRRRSRGRRRGAPLRRHLG